ncbi:helix-turn-helix domain-containing protein [Vagococcus salmoninarum]|nr:helix-turn-helix transcriptional regulator [Vagococcus salmoninarum]
MELLQFGPIIQEQRRKQKLTQEELALAMSVSKSSVSKWENNQTYPDMILLPRLATFFNITIDELLGYTPQLSKTEIINLYQELALKFTYQPVEDVLQEAENYIGKYYACLPLLLQMSLLYINHYNLLAKPESQKELLVRSIQLLERVKVEGKVPSLINQSNSLMAVSYLQLGQADKVLELLSDSLDAKLSDESLLATAYGALGQVDKSREILQAASYQSLQELLGLSSQLLLLEVNNFEKFAEIERRIRQLIDNYDIKKLHPFNVISFLLNVFNCCLEQQAVAKALEVLSEILAILKTVTYPIKIQGDDYFDLLDQWIEEQMTLVTSTAPRHETIVKESLLKYFQELPLIQDIYGENPQFIKLLADFEKELS